MNSPDQTPLLPIQDGEVLAAKYRVVRTIGVGGMGAVFAAVHLLLDEMVAIKVLLPTQLARPDAAARFLREGRAASKIKSAHVARVIDVGSLDSGLPFLVMEYLEGEDLSARIRSAGPQPTAVVVGWVLQACEAMIEAHARGIIHRDLKPSNLFLARRHDGSETIKVLDFGISKVSGELADGLLTASTTVMGSPFYMAPEQMSASGHVDARADVWSLGCILFEALTGRPPFMADDVTVLVARVLYSPVPPLRAELPHVSVELEAVVNRCLAKSPADRFASVQELANALLPLASELGVSQRFFSAPVSGAMSTQDTVLHLAGAPAATSAPVEPTLASSSMAPGKSASSSKRGWLVAAIVVGMLACGALVMAVTRASRGTEPVTSSPEATAPGSVGLPASGARSAPVAPVEASAPAVLPVVSVVSPASSSAPVASGPRAPAGPSAGASLARPPEKSRPKATTPPAGLPPDRD